MGQFVVSFGSGVFCTAITLVCTSFEWRFVDTSVGVIASGPRLDRWDVGSGLGRPRFTQIDDCLFRLSTI